MTSAKWSTSEHFEEFEQLESIALHVGGVEMAWLRLTLQDESMVLVNSTQITDMTALSNNRGTEMQMTSWAKRVRESVDEIAAMIEKAEWRERVLRCACAIMANEHANGLTSEQVWARAARFAAMEPERPADA